jgi:CRP/FNR family transcriptional regulator
MRISNDIESCKTCVYRQLLFGDLTEAEYEIVNAARTERIYRRGEVIVNENDPIDSFMYLRKGLVKLYKTDERGKDHLISINKPGDFVSLLSIFSDQKSHYSIAALEETMVCDVQLSAIRQVIAANHKFALRILNRMSHISDEVIVNRFEITRKQIKGRVAYILVFLADQIYRSREFRMPITRRELGELISMTTENTIRTLSEFRKDDIIEMDGRMIKIKDYKRLANVFKTG